MIVSTLSWKEVQVRQLLDVVQLIHIQTWANISCTTVARLCFFSLLGRETYIDFKHSTSPKNVWLCTSFSLRVSSLSATEINLIKQFLLIRDGSSALVSLKRVDHNA